VTERKTLAETITGHLFRDGQTNAADRLALMAGDPLRDLGGWCRGAVVDLIARNLPSEGGRLTAREPGLLQRQAVETEIGKLEAATEVWEDSGQSMARSMRRALGDLRTLCRSEPAGVEKPSGSRDGYRSWTFTRSATRGVHEEAPPEEARPPQGPGEVPGHRPLPGPGVPGSEVAPGPEAGSPGSPLRAALHDRLQVLRRAGQGRDRDGLGQGADGA